MHGGGITRFATAVAMLDSRTHAIDRTRPGHVGFFATLALALIVSTPLCHAAAEAPAPLTPASQPLAPGASAPDAARGTEADYRIGAQDLMEVVVYGQPELTRTVRVNAQGFISLPLIGLVPAAGLTAQQVEQRIAERLGDKYLQNPQVTVFIKEYTTLRFSVEGAVNKPGVYPLTGQMTLLRALAIAGGQGQLSDVNDVMLFRAGRAGTPAMSFDVEKIRAGEVPDPPIENDDLVVVKRSKARTAIKDSLLGDILQTLNPFSYLR